MIVFMTSDNLLVLAECPVLFMDGTFKAAPNMFSQLFTIHGLYHDHVVSLVYALMPDKRRATYHKLFDVVKGKLGALNCILNPTVIVTDLSHLMLVDVVRAINILCFISFSDLLLGS